VDDTEVLDAIVLGSDDCVVGITVAADEEVLEEDSVSTTDPMLNVEVNALGAGALNVSVVGLLQFTFTPSASVPQHDHEFVVEL
jgi:hypothetical protein